MRVLIWREIDFLFTGERRERDFSNRNLEGRLIRRTVALDSPVQQTSLRRDADASKQVGEPGIGAKGVPERLYFEVSETIEPLLVSLF
jgi:hypothetical protein